MLEIAEQASDIVYNGCIKQNTDSNLKTNMNLMDFVGIFTGQGQCFDTVLPENLPTIPATTRILEYFDHYVTLRNDVGMHS